jgi:hypothetical protein
MRSECQRFYGNKQSICNGDTNIPKWKVDQYRILWGLEPLYGTEKPNGSTTNNKPQFIKSKNTLGTGPGTELIKIYEQAGVPSCSQCYELADKMNKWGVDGCLQNLNKIVEDILPRAKQWIASNKPWVNKLLPDRLKEAGIIMKIKQDVNIAISKTKEKRSTFSISVAEKPKRTPVRNCGCGKKKPR